MPAKMWKMILGMLCLVALGVQAIWFVIVMELDLALPRPVIVLLVLFPGSMAWLMPVGFAWLWKDEVDRP